MKVIRRIAIKAERTGKFNGTFKKILSVSFILRRLPTVFIPPKAEVSSAKRLSGKGYFRQVLERLILLIMFRSEPDNYYICALFVAERYARAGEFLDFRQLSFLNFFLNQKKTTILTEDKVLFAELCNQNGLRTAPIIARLHPETTSEKELELELRPIAASEGVFFKPRFGMKGNGAGKLVYHDSGKWSLLYAAGKGLEGPWPEIFTSLQESNKEELVFQPLLRSHPDLANFNPDSIQSVRFITFRDCDTIRPLMARMRLGIDNSLVDASYSAIGVPIDLQSKSLRRGGQKKAGVLPESIKTFGPDNQRLEGFEVPYFDEVEKLALAVHEAFPEIFSLGHDIFILEDGPIILETNHIWGDPQFAHNEGLGSFHPFIDGIIKIAKCSGL